MKLQIPVNEAHSSSQLTGAVAFLQAPEDVTVGYQGSNDGLNWQTVATSRFLPADSPTPIPPSLRNYQHFRVTVQPEPRHRTLECQSSPDADLVVPDVVKTRSITIERDQAGLITKVKKQGGREIDIIRDNQGAVAGIDDGSRQWAVVRDEQGQVAEVTVT